jgi:GT2 family glycosyltransferase
MSRTVTTSTQPDREHVSVSVVIISKDEPALAETLAALAPLTEPTGDAPATADEIVVVDASDGRLDAIRDAHPGVRWIPFPRPAGAGITIPEQRNTGVSHASGDVIVFTDAGCVPEPGWLERLLAPILDGGEAVVCGRTGSRGASVYDGVPPGTTLESPPTHVDECPTINMAFRRDVFDRVDGFDESFDYGSDIDFSWRLSGAGVAIRYVPDAVVVHDWGDPARQRRRAVQYGRARARLYRKHPRRIARMLRDDPIVAAYPVFLLGLPLTLRHRWYPLLLAVPLWRNRMNAPVRVVVDHLWFGSGVLRELGAGVVAAARRNRARTNWSGTSG